MVNRRCLMGFVSLCAIFSIYSDASAAGFDPRTPRSVKPSADGYSLKPMDVKNMPDFADYSKQGNTGGLSSGTALQTGLQSATLPTETRMKLVVEYPVSATTSLPGDLFEGHVKEDLFLGRALILPRGSLVRGRISEVKKPGFISRAAKIGLKLDQIVTPTGEVIPLDATLEFAKGTTNRRGELDPGTGFGSRVGGSVRTVAGLNEQGAARGALVAANVATLGAPIVATAIGSSAIALFRTGDNVSLNPGQELEILLTNDLGLQLN